jgi:hypothetical protein
VSRRPLGALAVTALVALAATGCSTYAAARYSVSPETVSALRAYRPMTVAVGPFTAARAGEAEITCRAVGPIKTPDGESFEEFVRRAFIAELMMAELYAVAAPFTLTGHIQRLDFTSGIYFTDAAWDVALMLKSSNGKSLVASERYAFKASYGAEAGCLNAAQALMPAIQNVVGKAIRDPAFSDLLK